MLGRFTVMHLSGNDFKYAMSLNTFYNPSYTRYLEIEVMHYFNEQNFIGRILNKEKYISRHDERISSIIRDYQDKKESYFTYDGIQFFVITNMAFKTDAEGIAEFHFRFINKPSFSDINTAFMVMPFAFEELNKYYNENIKGFLNTLSPAINVFRSDDFKGSDVVADTILEQIKKAEFIICDITNCNKNVFFEIGFAKALNKDIIFMLEKNKPHAFFDVNHIRRIEYSYDKPAEFRELLAGTLESMRQHRNN